MTKGLLDLLDAIDCGLGGTLATLEEAYSKSRDRSLTVRTQNNRLIVQEIRRRIERVGQETKT